MTTEEVTEKGVVSYGKTGPGFRDDLDPNKPTFSGFLVMISLHKSAKR